jgi:hypothetical protein
MSAGKTVSEVITIVSNSTTIDAGPRHEQGGTDESLHHLLLESNGAVLPLNCSLYAFNVRSLKMLAPRSFPDGVHSNINQGLRLRPDILANDKVRENRDEESKNPGEGVESNQSKQLGSDRVNPKANEMWELTSRRLQRQGHSESTWQSRA